MAIRQSASIGRMSMSLVAATVSIGLSAPMVQATPQATFSDVSFSYWARPFIESLARNNILKGYPDATYRPDAPITRAQFDAVLDRTFGMTAESRNLADSDQALSRLQGLVMLSNRLDLEPQRPINETLRAYRDAIDIPSYAREGVAAATESQLVVNYPNVRVLDPYQAMTRADAAAFIYQALAHKGYLSPIPSESWTARYIVEAPTATEHTDTPTATSDSRSATMTIARGTQIPLAYPGARNVNLVIAPGETYATTLAVAEPVRNAAGEVLIPEGSRIEGRFIPIKINGTTPATQFVADRLVMGDERYALSATSGARVAIAESAVKPSDLEDAVTTAAAQELVHSITGQSSGIKGLFSNIFGSQRTLEPNRDSVIIVEPDSLVLTTQSGLQVAS